LSASREASISNLGTITTRGNLVGIGYAVVAFGVFAIADSIVKWLCRDYSVVQVSFATMIAALLPALALLPKTGGLRALRPNNWRLVLLRALLIAVDTILIFYAFSVLPLVQVYAIVFTEPFMLTALSVLLLAEVAGKRRWLAIGVGFLGVLVMLRPGLLPLGLGHLAAFAATIAWTFSLVVLRRIAGSETSACLLVSVMVATAAGVAPFVPFDYTPFSLADLLLVVVAGVMAGLGHLALIRGLRHATASAVAFFQYTLMLWGLIFGWVLFGDWPDMLMFAGAGVIVVSGAYLLWHESKGNA